MSSLALMRLSLVRFGASLLVVLTTGVINRVFIGDLHYNEWAFTLLLALQQLATPLTLVTGYWSDRYPIFGRRRVPHILFWAVAAAASLAILMLVLDLANSAPRYHVLAFAVAAVAMLVFGLGVKASNLLVTALLVDRLTEFRRGHWLIVIWGVAILGLVVGGGVFAELFRGATTVTVEQLTRVTLWTCLVAVALAVIGLVRVEPRNAKAVAVASVYRFWPALRAIARNPHARAFFGFLALADFSFYCQDLILEVYGEAVFHLSVSDTTQYNLYHGLGTLAGMALLWSLEGAAPGWPRTWQLPCSCLLGAGAFGLLIGSAALENRYWVVGAVLLLGFAKGAFNAALAGAIMELTDRRLTGIVLGMWGTFSGLAIAAGMFSGGVFRQGLLRTALAANLTEEVADRVSFGGVFAIESLGLLLAAALVWRFRLRDYREHLEAELANVAVQPTIAR
jgi:BCD family chlorophyll transporter-like MFS transporter